MDFLTGLEKRRASTFFRQIAFFTLFALTSLSAKAATPNLALVAPAEGFVGESFCTEANLTNTGSAGFGPYFQVISAPGYTLSSAEFLGSPTTQTLVGTFSGPTNELTDPISAAQVSGEAGGQLHVVSYPVGSVVAGQPDLTMDLCFAVDPNETINVLRTDAFGLVPAYEFGDTPTGDNGPIVGTRDDRNFTPRVITYRIEDFTAEMENPPGPAFTFEIEAIADIAASRTVSPIDFATISPIVLPPNVQFAGPVTFSIPGCTANTPAAPPPESPGGSITLSCPSATGNADPTVDEDVVVTIPVYIVDTLDEGSCSTESAINTAKHVTLLKSASGGTAPGGTINYSLDFQVSEYVDGIDSLIITDTIPDGLTYAGNVTLNVGGSFTLVPSVTTSSPGVGQTTVIYDVTAVTGPLGPTAVGQITYEATVDQNYEAAPLTGQPLRARDALTNTVVADYDIQNGANACQDNSSATVQVPDVTSEKTLVSPANGLLQPGDSAVWRLSLDIPSGDTQQISFRDFFPLPVIDVTTIDTSLPLSGNTSISLVTPDHTIGDPVAISVDPAENRLDILWPDISASSGQRIVVEVSTVISSEPFANGLVLSNILEASTNRTIADNISGLNIANITLQQPDLSITKTAQAPNTNLEAGDTVTFDIAVTNEGDAEAYDVLVNDVPAAGLSSCSTTSVSSAGSGDIFSGGFTLAGDLAAGASLNFVATCTLAPDVTNRTTYTNTASVVWAGQPGATLFPVEEDTADVVTDQVSAFKDLISTSEAHTPDIDGGSPLFPRPLVTGEIVRYRTWAYLPQGVTESAEIRDLLPNGLEYVAGQTFLGLVSNSGAALTAPGLSCSSGNPNQVGDDSDVTSFTLTCAVEPTLGGVGSGNDPRFILGDITNAEDDANEELVILEFNARVVGDVVNGTNLNNRMRLGTSNGSNNSNIVSAVQRTPLLEIDKSVTPTSADADDTVEYTIVFNHAAGSSVSAYDLALTDILPAGVTYDSGAGITGPVAPATPGTDTCTLTGLTVDDSNPDTTGLTIAFDELSVGDVCEVRFQATTTAAVKPGEPITNTVSLDFTSLPDAGTNPNITGSAPGADGVYSVEDSADLTIDSVELTKSIVSTTVVETSDLTADTSGDPRPLTLGETARYRLQMRLPEGDAPAYIVTDALPAGLQYVANSATIAFVADGAGTITASPGITCSGGTLLQNGDEASVASITPNCGLEPSGGPFTSGTDPVWNLGNLMNSDMDTNDEFVVIEFSAILLNDASNINGTQRPNAFDLSVDGTVTSSNSAVAEVQVPAFGLAKRVSSGPTNNADGTYAVEYTLVVENPGPYAVGSVQVTDDLSNAFSGVSYVVDNVAATNLTPNFPGFDGSGTTELLSGTDSLGSGASGTITIAVTVTPGTNLGSFDNTATATSVLPTGVQISDVSHDGAAPDGDSDGFANDDSDVTTVSLVEGAEIGLAKRVATGPTTNNDGSYTLTYGFVLENSGEANLANVQITDNLAATFSGASFTVDALSSSDVSVNFPGFDGSGQQNLLASGVTLTPTEVAEVLLTVTVTPGGNLGPYSNTANASGTAPSGAVVNDQSHDGLVADGDSNGDPTNDSDVTPVSFAETPVIGLAKSIASAPQNNEDGTYTFAYRLFVENSGDVELRDLQIFDELSTAFADATGFVVDSVTSSDFAVNFPGYDGIVGSETGLLTGNETLPAGASGEVTLALTVTPGSDLGPYNNTATAQGSSPGGASVSDVSDFGVVPDGNADSDPSNDSDATPVSFSEVPQLGLAKVVVGDPLNNGDGSYTLTYQLRVANTGAIVLNNLQVVDDLSATFTGAQGYQLDSLSSAALTVNANFGNGGDFNLLTGADSLAANTSATVDLVVTVTPGSNLGPYLNTATVSGESPGGEVLTDTSDDAPVVDEDGNGDPTDDSDPTAVTFAEAPVLGLAKQLLNAPVNNGDGSYSLVYRLTIENSGDIAIRDVQVSDNLASTFSGATSYSVDSLSSPDLAINGAFDGSAVSSLLAGTDTLAVDQISLIDLALTVVPGANFGPYNNVATATGLSIGGTLLSDDSANGTDPDTNGNDDPLDDSEPTPVSFSETASIGLAKAASTPSTPNFDGTFTSTFTLNLSNLGDVALSAVNLEDNLAVQLAPASLVRVENLGVTGDLTSINPAYDGITEIDLLSGNETLPVGGSAVVTFDAVFNPNDNPGPFSNQAIARGESPGNPSPGIPNVTDESTDGAIPDATPDNDPGNDSVPTPVTFVAGNSCSLVMPDELAPGVAFALTVTDNDAFYDDTLIETFPVTVTNTLSGETETVEVTETSASSGEFTGSLLTGYNVDAGPNNDGELFAENADVIEATYTDQLTATGGVGACSDSGVVLGLATLEGFAWLDLDTNDQFGAGEEALVGWIIRVEGLSGVIEVPVNADGGYSVPELLPGSDYSVSLVHPDSGAVFGQLTDITLPPQTTVLEQNLAIDPSGVFYDSVDRMPIASVAATLINSDGTPLPAACLLAGQQGQVTGDDGRYRFDVVPDADPACASGETYTLVITQPPEYNPGFSALLPPLAQALDPTGLGSPVRVGDGPYAPELGESTSYHVAFTLAAGDPDVVWNHIPLDPLGVGGFSVRLTKDVNQPTTSVGGLVSYTIALENLSPVTIPGISVVDSLPPGFMLVEESAALDGSAEDVVTTGARPVTFAGITLLSGQRRELTYVLRAGAGITHGEYANTATPFVGPAQIGNTDTAEVLVVADPDFEETTVIGKVWNDRDEDGWQDSAKATRIKVSVELARRVAGKPALLERIDRTSEVLRKSLHEGVVVKELPGRYGPGDFSNANEVSIRGTYSEKVDVRRITVSSAEGTRLVITGDDVRRNHRGAVRRGRNSQELEVHYQQYPIAGGGYELLIELRNQGLEEPGLPGVRLATVEGLVIETDASGRYHIAGVDGGFMERGRNFIVKLDPATVPEGTRIVSENPRVKRLSQGLMNEFDFAVHLPDFIPPEQTLSLKIAEVFFEPGSAVVLPEYRAQLSQLVTALNRGTRVSLSLKAQVTPGESGFAARQLAQERADALLMVLRELSGRDLTQTLKITIEEQVVDTEESDATIKEVEQTMTGKLKGALGWLLGAIVPAAHAAEADNCMSNICNAAGVPILIVEEPAPSVYNKSRLLVDQGRVDIHGDYATRLPDGGVIWMTEDPARPEPRLSIAGPSHVPASAGRFTADSEFVIHTNYATFFDQLRVEVFERVDVDRREPLAVLDIDTSTDKRLFYQVPWPLAGKPVPKGGELIYRVSALDAEGRADRTLEQRTFAVDEQTHIAQQEQQPGFGISAYTLQVVSVDDGVVVFVPGHRFAERLEIRPHFPRLGTTLGPQDRAKLDTIIDRWIAASEVRIEVIGHTSSVPIAARNRHLFADNYALSRARAQAVADYLANGMRKNVSDASAVGRGPDVPVGDNATEEGRALNRRAEISIIGNRVESEPTVNVVNRETGVATSFADVRRVAQLDDIARSVMPSAAAQTADVLLKRNDLKHRRIPVYGSRVRVQGNDVGADHQVWINGEAIRIDREERFAVEYILPAGSHVTALDVANGDAVTVQRAVPLEVTGRYGFMVALADFTLSDSNVTGSVEPLSGNDRYAEDMLVEGRLAFYLKGKVKGKYLITAQLDTQEEQVENLFDNIHEKDPQSLFRRLDPDRYYPVYGDDSTVVADVNTHGRMYVRVDWDNSEAVWGNFESGVTGTELTQYSRGLYGARFTHESMEATEFDESKRHLSAFVSENQTALGHSEFLGTGGSLYYFRHTDILPGSEKLRVEVRDPDTNRVLENNTLTRGLDYEVDELQGRVILSRPLLPLVQGGAPSLILDGALDGSIAVLVADYEYLPNDFDANQVVYGARAKQWFGNHVAVGGTYVEEGRADEDYTLAGVDLTLQGGRDSWLKLEWGSSTATQTNRFISTDGGLSFNNANVLNGTARSGDAYNVDLHLNGADFGLTSQWITNAWYKEVDDQFSVARRDDGANVLEYGVETQMPLRDWRLGARASHFEVDQQLERREAAVQIDGEIGSRGTLASEIKYIDESRTALSGNTNTTALLLGLQYEHRLAKWISLYAGGQTVLDDTGGYISNDQLSAGAKVALGRGSAATLEYRDGDRGDGALVSLEQRLTDRFAVYGTMTHSTDTTTDPFSGAGNSAGMLDNAGTNFAIGQRWALNDRARLFTERQFSRGEDFTGVGTVFGLDYATTTGWHYGFTAQDGDITALGGVIERQTLTVSAGHQGKATRFSSKLEYRDDSGAENVEQWLTSNRFEWKLSETYRLAAKLNYSESDNALDDASDAKLVEGSLGLARRPVETNRFNWLAKYTYLHDLQSFGQNRAQTDQRSHIGSWEGIYKLNQKLSLGGKAARRMGELRAARNSGPWFKSTANFGSGRLRWHALHKWDAMAEYRWLQIEEADNERAGWLVSIDRHIASNFKIGVGYNFTDFSDDLTDLDYDHKGWFLNVLGKY